MEFNDAIHDIVVDSVMEGTEVVNYTWILEDVSMRNWS